MVVLAWNRKGYVSQSSIFRLSLEQDIHTYNEFLAVFTLTVFYFTRSFLKPNVFSMHYLFNLNLLVSYQSIHFPDMEKLFEGDKLQHGNIQNRSLQTWEIIQLTRRWISFLVFKNHREIKKAFNFLAFINL